MSCSKIIHLFEKSQLFPLQVQNNLFFPQFFRNKLFKKNLPTLLPKLLNGPSLMHLAHTGWKCDKLIIKVSYPQQVTDSQKPEEESGGAELTEDPQRLKEQIEGTAPKPVVNCISQVSKARVPRG